MLLHAVIKSTSKVKQSGTERVFLDIREMEKRWEIRNFSGVHRVTPYKYFLGSICQAKLALVVKKGN